MAEFKKIGDFKIDVTSKKFQEFKMYTPIKLANTAKNHFLEGFRKGGGQTDSSIAGWKKRRYDEGPGRGILIKSGKLRGDIKVRQVRFDRIVVGTSNLTSDYAEIHNTGGKINVTAKQKGYFMYKAKNAKSKHEKEFWQRMIGATTIEIPKREFIGASRELDAKIEKMIIFEIEKIFKVGR